MSWPGLPRRRLDQVRQPSSPATAPGSSNIVRARYVIVYGPSGGVFIFSGTPTVGNLTASFTDPSGPGGTISGNTYLPGDVSYINGLFALQIKGTQITSYQAASAGVGPWTPVSGVNIGAGTSLIAPVLLGNNLASSLGDGNFLAVIGPSADATGATDDAAIFSALSSGWSVLLTPGVFYTRSVMGWSGADLWGCGDATTIQPGSAWSSAGGAILLQPGSGAAVRNLRLYGGSNTRSANPAINGIQIAAGAQFGKVVDVRCDYMGAWVFYGNPVSGSHWDISGLRGEHNGGGIACDNGTSANVAAEWNITRTDLQNCEVNPVYYASNVTDFLADGPTNGSILAGAAVKAIDIVGTCQTVHLFGLDVGGSAAGAAVLAIEANASGSPTDVKVGPGTVQDGAVGVLVSGAAARLYFHGLTAKGNKGDGFQLANTGAFNQLMACTGNTNNLAAGVAYDADVTSTGHWLIDGFAGVSGAVTDNVFLAVGNHVTLVNTPAATTTAGAAPGGW